MADTNALEGLTQALRKLPGVGAKSAARMAFHLLQHDKPAALQIARALDNAVQNIRHCALCNTLTEQDLCVTCANPQRDRSKLCVVETPADQAAMERTLAYRGLYFVLMGQALKSRGMQVTRLARGVPAGSELEYVDLGTIAHALIDRR